MILLVTFAFLAGLVTILSPCILPILPIILTGSVATGKRRPLGIITGFIVSFSFFTLFLSSIVRATEISADVTRTLSIVVISLFGLSLLIPKLQLLLEQFFSTITQLFSRQNKSGQHDGFVSGIIVGISLGLLWTPCVGPILASVITLAATSTVGSQAIAITLAYSIGTAIPMLGIMIGGRALLQKLPVLTTQTQRIQKIFGVLMIATALAIATNLDRSFQTWVLTVFPEYGTGLTQFEDVRAVREELDKLKKTSSPPESETSQYQTAPDLIPGGIWFNLPNDKTSLSLKELKGRVVLIDIWTYTCINCIRTLPYVSSWHAKYASSGLTIIGVHTPEFEFEKNPDNVEKAMQDFRILYPVMQDNNYATWKAYNNHYWPAKYLIDKKGKIRYSHFGEGDYDETERMIQELLSEDSVAIQSPITNPTYTVETATPETYLGYDRMRNFVSPERVQKNTLTIYSVPKELKRNTFGFSGSWLIGPEYSQPAKGSSLSFRFQAKYVYLVMRPRTVADSGDVVVRLDNEIQGKMVRVNASKLYTLVELSTQQEHTLHLEFLDDALEVYAFTFG